ncbi:MAG: S4 domain-containing protein, partial [Candidatus Roizmanbacteria bacterium]|nr:S4 domain-containing protein [Candidatus Roizmanbacteria bacterium]
PMILGTDGAQMSKSTGNCVWLDDSPEDMYGKIMSIPDGQIDSYVELLTNLNRSELKQQEPINQKKRLAYAVTTRFHDQEKANRAQEYFEKTVQNKEMPNDIPSLEIKTSENSTASDIASLMLSSSKSEAKRLVQQGGVEVDGKKVTDPNQKIEIKDGMIIKAGKRKYIKIKT